MIPGGTKDYQRLFLRAPYKRDILFSYNEEVFKTRVLNLSERGFLSELSDRRLLDQELAFMVEIPEYPLFKNYTLERLNSFSPDNMHSRTVRFRAKSVREIAGESSSTFKAGFSIEDINPVDQLKISKYIEHFSSNLIFLQVLIDSYTSDEKHLEKIRKIAGFLGYAQDLKISYLRSIVEHDYKGLQWL